MIIKTNINLIITSLLVAGSTAVFIFMVYSIDQQGELFFSQQEALLQQQAQEDSYQHLRRLAENTAEERSAIKDLFFSEKGESIDFLTLVETLAPQLNLKFKTNGLSEIKETDGSDWIEATFTFSGTKSGVESFIEILESLPYMSRLTKVVVGSDGGSVWSSSVTMQVQILSYETST